MYLIFDVETTGVPKDYKAPVTQLDNWPRITQLAWQLYGPNRQRLFEFTGLIKPDGWTVPKEPFFINNNMSTERCEAEGKPIIDALHMLVSIINHHKPYVVAHNMAFDSKVLGSEMLRAGLRANHPTVKWCTMQSSMNLLKLPGGRYGQYKWPKLEELHKFLFGASFENSHDALADVTACARCMFGLIDKGVVLGFKE